MIERFEQRADVLDRAKARVIETTSSLQVARLELPSVEKSHGIPLIGKLFSRGKREAKVMIPQLDIESKVAELEYAETDLDLLEKFKDIKQGESIEWKDESGMNYSVSTIEGHLEGKDLRVSRFFKFENSEYPFRDSHGEEYVGFVDEEQISAEEAEEIFSNGTHVLFSWFIEQPKEPIGLDTSKFINIKYFNFEEIFHKFLLLLCQKEDFGMMK